VDYALSAGLRNKTAARHCNITDTFCVGQNGVELNNLRSRRYQDIYRPRIHVGMRALHMNDTFIFRGFEFRQMCVYRRRFSSMRMHMEQRREEHRQKKRRYFATGRQFSHGRYCADLAVLKSTARHLDASRATLSIARLSDP
jgi:hypothetical protein